jgi:hypothetical protein
MMERLPTLPSELVNEIVSKAHTDLAAVRALIEQEPALVNAAWDWGGGDFETPLNSAAHMGRRDIAQYLLEHGARLDLPAAVMLGELAIVRGIIEAYPATRFSTGAHGIPLIVHAMAGGEASADVLAYLQSFD